MKDERHVRQRRAEGKKWRPAAILLAGVLAFLSLPITGKAVYAVDVTQPCSLTVHIGTALPEGADKADLQEADIVYDLYRIADAEPVAGFDTYSWKVLEPFGSAFQQAGLAEVRAAADGGLEISPTIEGQGWDNVARAAATVALGTVPEGNKPVEPRAAGAFAPGQKVNGTESGTFSQNGLSQTVSDLRAGLYLIVAHGAKESDGSDMKEMKEYVTASGIEGDTGLATIAHSRHYTYSFTPQLISLPTKEGLNTAQSAGDWDYDGSVDMTLKYGKEVRVGNLLITKDLLTYAQREKTSEGTTRAISDPATFVFDVSVYESKEAYNPEDKKAARIYHDYVSIVFDSNGDYSIIGASDGAYEEQPQPYGKKTARIENLPIDSFAVVEEAYSGRAYTTDSTKTATITLNDDDNTVGVEFENDYGDKHSGGGSVTNRFTYKGDESKWGWEQVTDASESRQVIQSDAKTE